MATANRLGVGGRGAAVNRPRQPSQAYAVCSRGFKATACGTHLRAKPVRCCTTPGRNGAAASGVDGEAISPAPPRSTQPGACGSSRFFAHLTHRRGDIGFVQCILAAGDRLARTNRNRHGGSAARRARGNHHRQHRFRDSVWRDVRVRQRLAAWSRHGRRQRRPAARACTTSWLCASGRRRRSPCPRWCCSTRSGTSPRRPQHQPAYAGSIGARRRGSGHLLSVVSLSDSSSGAVCASASKHSTRHSVNDVAQRRNHSDHTSQAAPGILLAEIRLGVRVY